MAGNVTLKDIARRADLSIAAVSKVLSDYPSISVKTKKRVRQLCREMRYRPRKTAPARNSSLQRIAIVLIETTLPRAGRSAAKLAQLTHYAPGLGMRLEAITVVGEDAATQVKRLADVANGMQAVLLYGMIGAELLRGVDAMELPFVLLGNVIGDPIQPLPRVHQVTFDHAAMGEMATRSLIRAGHKRIGFMAGVLPEGGWFERWHAGYLRAHLHAGLPIDAALTQGRGAEYGVAMRAVDAYLKFEHRPTAFVIPDAETAASFQLALRQADWQVDPTRIVVGCTREDIQTYNLGEHPLVFEDLEQFMRACLAILKAMGQGVKLPPGRTCLPFITRNLDRIQPHS